MGRTVFVEEKIEKYISDLYSEGSWYVGLIVGQQSVQRDYVVHLIKTPPQEEGSEEFSGTKKRPNTIESLDDVWVVTHAKQVLRMLPGGLDILGIFAMAPAAAVNAVHMKLKQMLYSVNKLTNKASMWSQSEGDITERILLQICSSTRKLTCRTFDVADNQGIAKPADWKYQSFADRWIIINSNVATNLKFYISNNFMCQSLQKQIMNGLSSYCKSIWNATVTLNHHILEDDSILDSVSAASSSKKGKKHVQPQPLAKEYNAEIFAKTVGHCSHESLDGLECGGFMVMRGTICCKAFVHNKATFKDATKAIKRDVIRSLISRCELLCEDFAAQEEEQYEKVVMETPKRIYAPLIGSVISLCDYAFPDEKIFESQERFRDLVELDLNIDELNDQSERLPTNEDLLEAEQVDKKKHKVKDISLTNYGKNLIGMAIGSMVAVLAAGVSFIFINQE